MVTIEDIEIWIRENGDSEGFYDTEALVNHFVNISKAELIEKTCEWLDSIMYYVSKEDKRLVCGFTDFDGLVNDFKKEMDE